MSSTARRRAAHPLFLVNEGLAFLLEVAALVLLGWWGATRSLPVGGAVALAVGAPLGAAVLWGAFAAPKARLRVPLAVQLAVKAVVFGAGALALLGLGHGVAAACFAVATLLNTTAATYHRTHP
ncbi:YrdB family protein [Streptomyces sp. NPDC002138]|uniref:YrdB family protein n=1 Tax=Streptomyces sp. NPDC002138 TaxID=3154410 RepID=UPI00331C89CC